MPRQTSEREPTFEDFNSSPARKRVPQFQTRDRAFRKMQSLNRFDSSSDAHSLNMQEKIACLRQSTPEMLKERAMQKMDSIMKTKWLKAEAEKEDALETVTNLSTYILKLEEILEANNDVNNAVDYHGYPDYYNHVKDEEYEYRNYSSENHSKNDDDLSLIEQFGGVVRMDRESIDKRSDVDRTNTVTNTEMIASIDASIQADPSSYIPKSIFSLEDESEDSSLLKQNGIGTKYKALYSDHLEPVKTREQNSEALPGSKIQLEVPRSEVDRVMRMIEGWGALEVLVQEREANSFLLTGIMDL
eukprot:CAMPEP_0113300032 /NCGR_PEP_ID=MMETSP0010_2-20120614/1828_1 /TAXON_ID=216773 ORGANISM="Corethron hystrix, Strain 308" /NCGR_SAMPLE_ID=MMETSP0010_2 /ASSEMBLY_ACC=CAM_ASM_000155 /LENGTH=301 /DNA_ID=CAMNT_0000153383 /DNA_START=218 /DNA_END=1123 /DNA_ORIENTATION=+ /assembly_acc=CAM_ASM_000155